MKITTPRIPSGFSEYLPGDQIEFNRLRDIIRETYERYGYAPLDTPDIELSEVLLAVKPRNKSIGLNAARMI